LAAEVAMAHGHYEPPETPANPLRPSWIFEDEEIAAMNYLALGHWTAQYASAAARFRPSIRARRSLPGPSIWFA
jgi:hypothetical protein